MKATEMTRYAFVVLLLIFGYLSYLVIAPFLSYLLFSIVLVMVFNPWYKWLVKKTGKKRFSSMLLVLALICLLVIPGIFVGYKLISEAPSAYEAFATSVNVQPAQQFVEGLTGQPLDFAAWIQESVDRFRSYILQNATDLIGGVTTLFIGLFVMFFVMYYLFTGGTQLLNIVKKHVPIAHRHQTALLKEVDEVIHGIIEGQLVLGLIQGILGGLAFWALGLPNPIFWGFVMTVLSVIPVLGSFIVWVPAGLWLLLVGPLWKGVAMLIFGGVIISQVDNFLRPIIVGKRADVHPTIVIVGVFGGLAAFGVAGFIVGPLILALLVALLRFYKQEVL